jgi:hypothetical protein
MSPQFPPLESHRCHWSENVNAVALDHAPFVAVRVWPCCAVPEIAGRLVLTGALGVVV